MRHFYSLIFLLNFSVALAQSPEPINTFVGLTDTLATHEIRIYKRISITNCTEVFRLYESEKEGWTAELYFFYEAAGDKHRYYEKQLLKNLIDFDVLWFNITKTQVLHILPMDLFKYKFRRADEILCEDNRYVYKQKIISILDGVSYNLFIRQGDKTNSVNYTNPKTLLKHYPGVDELEYFCEMLDVVSEGFDIWK
ncbi:hypothetical protein KJK34_06855 [Flavobacterium sp. D11R37]|uniref:hypothetical protein n=1 Tax=Flavobacterium coralii TaxID=2838017 RepID=UPI001CA788B7|nr:hypothetical protein [Flavobacterium coralii]MBY8962467.1 hypothetical protein [Flavobacterium coralii]